VEWLGWYEERIGNPGLALKYVPEHLRKHFDPKKPRLGISPQEWYPVEALHALLDVVTAPLEGSALDAVIDESAKAAMRGLLTRSMSSFRSGLGSAERYTRVSNALWRLVFDSGRVSVTSRGPRQHEGTISDWRGHHPAICRFAMMCQVAIYEHMGFTGVRVQHQCVARGATKCGSIVEW
jgi:hypothetical protein